jgi:hypothetical protein
MDDARHPLVGKRIVTGTAASGEVTKDLINRTLGKVTYVEDGSWSFSDVNERNTWTVRHNGDLRITAVERH